MKYRDGVVRIEFADGTWGILMTDMAICERIPQGMDFVKYLIDRGHLNPRSDQILGATNLIDRCLWILYGRSN